MCIMSAVYAYMQQCFSRLHCNVFIVETGCCLYSCHNYPSMIYDKYVPNFVTAWDVWKTMSVCIRVADMRTIDMSK